MNDNTSHSSGGDTSPPITFLIAKWHGFVLAAMYLLYGGVKIIFGMLDRNYDRFGEFSFWFAIGVLLIALAYGYQHRKKWGWAGLIAVNGSASVYLLFTFSGVNSAILLMAILVGLVALLLPATKQQILGH